MYDYIIIGSGSAGSVLANRLSEDPGVSVLLLEAGSPDKNPWIHVPAGFAKLQNPSVNWCYFTAPQKNLNNRRLWCPLGKTLGGSSSINGMIYIRGQKQDYDAWAQDGNTGWSYANVLPYFKRAENNESLSDIYHGHGGPLQVSNQKTPNITAWAYVKAAQQAGHKFNPDFNGDNQLGTNLYQVTQKDGRRASTAVCYLNPAKKRSNLKIITNALTHNILIENGKAVGVEYIKGSKSFKVNCEKEIIVSAGALNTPKLLLLSGIGPADELKKLDIDIKHDLPGVGKNYQDHLNSYVVSDLKDPISYDGQNEFPKNIKHGLQWFFFKNGAATSPVAEGGCFISTDGSGRADIQTHVLPAYVVNAARTKVDGHGITINSCVMRPTSRGSVTINSKDPKAEPVIDPNYHDTEHDRKLSIESIKQIREILSQPAISKYIKRERFPSKDAKTDDEILSYIKQYASIDYHPVGTCKMGTDQMSVVDPELKVHGLDGLRVVDNSIMPYLNSGNTNAPAIMIGEKGSALIKGEAILEEKEFLEAV